MYSYILLFLISVTCCRCHQEKEDATYKKKHVPSLYIHPVLELLYDVDAPKVNASYSPDPKQNIILFVTNMPKEIQNIDELKSKFPVHGYVEADGDAQTKGIGGLYASVMGIPHDNDGNPILNTGDCDSMLENSIASLLGWASNVRGMTTALVRIEEGSTETSIHTPGAEMFEHMFEDVQFVPSAQELAREEQEDQSEPEENADSVKGSEEDNSVLPPYDQEQDVVYDDNGYEHYPRYWKDGEFTPLQDYRAHAVSRRAAEEGFSVADDYVRNRKRIVLPKNEFKRETYYKSSPARQELIKPSNIDTNRYNKYNVFDLVRESFLDKFLNSIGLPASVTDEMNEMDNFDANSIGKVRPPSYYQLVRDALRSVRSQSDHAADSGYLLTVKGGRAEDTRDFVETLKYVIRNAPEDKTLIVLSGSCPRYGSDAAFIANRGSRHYKGPEKIPYYATGPRSLKLDHFKRLYELPQAIKEALSKPIDTEYDYYDKETRSVKQTDSHGNPSQNSNKNVLHTEKIDKYRERLLNIRKELEKQRELSEHSTESNYQKFADDKDTILMAHSERSTASCVKDLFLLALGGIILLCICL